MSPSSQRQLKVYYLDDEPELLEVFADTFSTKFIAITTFSDPQSVIEKVQSDPPDVLFLDYTLPNTTGDEIASRLDHRIPKVLVTGDLNAQPQSHFLAQFGKPYPAEKIRQFLQKYLDNLSL